MHVRTYCTVLITKTYPGVRDDTAYERRCGPFGFSGFGIMCIYVMARILTHRRFNFCC
jgi:hypothetical protein